MNASVPIRGNKRPVIFSIVSGYGFRARPVAVPE
jgi:hypothetical protein